MGAEACAADNRGQHNTFVSFHRFSSISSACRTPRGQTFIGGLIVEALVCGQKNPH
jgi:hypothetical protein